jgi:thymidylate synthase (FAD)
MSASVRLVQTTEQPEKNMAYVARVSNPPGQDNPNAGGLLRYCIKHGHWSVFEHAYMTLEINTTVAMATQLLRHRSFVFQQFSQRYADANLLARDTDAGTVCSIPHLRMQDTVNRQNSLDTCPEDVQAEFARRMRAHFDAGLQLYNDMLGAGVAKECARFVLPQATMTRIEMTGNCRSWIHYLQMRCTPDTQAEHRQVALLIKDQFCHVFPTVAAALQWTPVVAPISNQTAVTQ